MQLRRLISPALFALTIVAGATAQGQTTAGSGTVIVLPLAANIPAAYATTVFVQNPNTNAITINVRYYQSDNALPVGNGTPYTCTPLTIPASMAVTFDLASECTFSGTNNFGMIILEDVTSNYKTNAFFAYSRTEQPTGSAGPGNGFSVEGFPVGNFSGAQADVLGLKRTGTAPNYKSNCFVGALNEPVNYQIQLRQGDTGAFIGNYPLTGTATLGAYHTTRILDIFANATSPSDTTTNFSNVTATFVNISNSSMIGFCTVETTQNGSADFRVAKSDDASDNRQSRLACYGQDSCGSGVPSSTNPALLASTTTKNIHYLILDQPDFVRCDLVSDTPAHLADLEILLRPPGNPQSTSPFVNSVPPYNALPYTSGGQNKQFFYIYTGERSTISGGATTRWYIDVSFDTITGNALDLSGSGVPYGITCKSGNGVTVPWFGTTGLANP